VSQLPAIVELHAFAQEKRVGLAIRGNLPTMRQIGNDGLAAVQRIAPDEVIVHRPLRPHVGDRAGLVDIKMRWGTEYPIAQHPTAFSIGVRGAQFEVWRGPDLWRAGQALRQPIGACGSPEGSAQQAPARVFCGVSLYHSVSFRRCTCSGSTRGGRAEGSCSPSPAAGTSIASFAARRWGCRLPWMDSHLELLTSISGTPPPAH